MDLEMEVRPGETKTIDSTRTSMATISFEDESEISEEIKEDF